MTAGEPPLTLVTGPSAAGRTHALDASRRAATGAGRRVLTVRLAPADRDEPWYLVGRILAELAPLSTRLAAGRGNAVATERSFHAVRPRRRRPAEASPGRLR